MSKTLDQLAANEALEFLILFGRVRYLEAYHPHSRELEQAIQELASFSDDIHYAFQVKDEARKKSRIQVSPTAAQQEDGA